MPKVRRSKKATPDGWELIEPTLEELEQKMREGKLSLILVMLFNYKLDQVNLLLYEKNFNVREAYHINFGHLSFLSVFSFHLEVFNFDLLNINTHFLYFLQCL